MASIPKPAPLSTFKSVSPPSFLPLPRALRQNRSFAQLTRLLGITAPQDGSDSGSEDCDDDDEAPNSNSGDDDGDGPSDVDEESLMWDAQTALIAHQPTLAAKYYATAALPPYCSSAACLALGNLLARGSSLSQPPDVGTQTPESVSTSPVANSPQTSWFASIFGTPLPSSPPASLPSPTAERRSSFVSNGWSLPTDGKRVMRDVEGMGKAGGWLILGIGWIVDAKSPPGVNIYPAAVHSETSDDDHNMIVFDSKGKGRARPFHIASSTMSSSDSFDIATPDDDDNVQTTGEKIKLLYNLLIPLLHLYRHGHIQHLDPVALPSLTSSQLPQALRPQGDHQKGRNVWALGSTVATKVLELPLLSAGGLTKEESMKRDGIGMVANYIRGITSAPQIAEASFKTILRHGPCGIEVVDDLLHQAYRRLNVLLKTTGGSPLAQSELDAYPFLASDRTLGARRRSAASLLSLADSMVPSSLRLMTPVKSIASLASLSCEASTASAHDLPHDGHGGAAMQSLCNVQRHQRKLANRPPPVTNTWWPSLRNWSMTPRSPLAPIEREQTPPPERSSPTSDTFERKVPIRAVASSPQLGTRRLPFEPEHAVAKIDPEFAALELASALTKHVTCSVCGAGGVNFPNCRKCGLTFCCRKCRVDESGAGDGKRHICGAWESRKLQSSPPAVITVPSVIATPVH